MSYHNVTMSPFSSLTDLLKCVFCILIDVWINPKCTQMCGPVRECPKSFFVIKEVFEDYNTLWTYAQNSYSVHLSLLFWVFKRLIHQIFSTKGNACPSCNILLTNEDCQPHFFQLSFARSASCQIFILIFSGIFLVLWIYLVVCIYCHHFCDKFLLNVYVLFHITSEQLFSQTYFT